MKRLLLLIPLLLVLIGCHETDVYFDGSVGIYPEPDGNIFWALIYDRSSHLIEDAKVILDSTYNVNFEVDYGGYYRDEIPIFEAGGTYTVEVQMNDYDNIYGDVDIPSNFNIDITTSEDTVIIKWTEPDSMLVPADQWRLKVINSGDSVYTPVGFSADDNDFKFIGQSGEVKVSLDAISGGELTGARGNSVLAGVLRKSKTVVVSF